jgi:hypothetical protein
MAHIEKNLTEFYKKLDSLSNWAIAPDEAVNLTLGHADAYLTSETLHSYVTGVIEILEGVAYQRKGDAVSMSEIEAIEDELCKILKNAPQARRPKRSIDLRDKEEIQLPDGSIISINCRNPKISQ